MGGNEAFGSYTRELDEVASCELLFGRRRRNKYTFADATVNPIVQRAPFFRRSEAGFSDRAGAVLRNAEPPAPISSQLVTGHHIILRQIHADELGSQEQND